MLALIKALTLIELSFNKSILLAADQRSKIWIICSINQRRYAIVHFLTKLNHFVLDWHTLCLLLSALENKTLSSSRTLQSQILLEFERVLSNLELIDILNTLILNWKTFLVLINVSTLERLLNFFRAPWEVRMAKLPHAETQISDCL